MPRQRANGATFVLADISGYTAFLTAVGVAHREQLEGGQTPAAYPLMTSLLDAIVANLAPPFVLAKLEGDAVFAYADDEALLIRGDQVRACLAACYLSFREHLKRTEGALTCSCEACVTVTRLDLKFTLHHGSYIAQAIAGSMELLGPDVTTAHRMLKNDVVAMTGWPAYALLSAAAAQHLDVSDEAGRWLEFEYEHVGRMRALAIPLRRDG